LRQAGQSLTPIQSRCRIRIPGPISILDLVASFQSIAIRAGGGDEEERQDDLH
jgi:hypothetical protein